jgi:hypothetical protein
VFRHGQPVFITEPQQYPDCWNAPLQVRGGPLAAADLAGAVISEVEVLPGDVIAVGEWGKGWVGWEAGKVGCVTIVGCQACCLTLQVIF